MVHQLLRNTGVEQPRKSVAAMRADGDKVGVYIMGEMQNTRFLFIIVEDGKRAVGHMMQLPETINPFPALNNALKTVGRRYFKKMNVGAVNCCEALHGDENLISFLSKIRGKNDSRRILIHLFLNRNNGSVGVL